MNIALNMENPVQETLSLITEYYHHNLEPFFAALSEDCCWISPAEKIIRGAEAIRAEFKEIVMPVCHIEQAELFQLGDSASGHITVCGNYLIYAADSQSEMMFADQQRLTFVIAGRVKRGSCIICTFLICGSRLKRKKCSR